MSDILEPDEKRFVGINVKEQRIEFIGNFRTYSEMEAELRRRDLLDDYTDIRDVDSMIFEAELDPEVEVEIDDEDDIYTHADDDDEEDGSEDED